MYIVESWRYWLFCLTLIVCEVNRCKGDLRQLLKHDSAPEHLFFFHNLIYWDLCLYLESKLTMKWARHGSIQVFYVTAEEIILKASPRVFTIVFSSYRATILIISNEKISLGPWSRSSFFEFLFAPLYLLIFLFCLWKSH